jgi:hypothetical protein
VALVMLVIVFIGGCQQYRPVIINQIEKDQAAVVNGRRRNSKNYF